MIEDVIRERVRAHYDQPELGDRIMMLSDLGADLRDMGLWPVDSDDRPLSTFVEAVEGVTVVRDPAQKAFVVVVPDDRLSVAEEAISRRADMRWLRRLPRAALVAFCLDMPDGLQVYLRPSAPVQYSTGAPPPNGDGYLPIEAKFRLNGLYVRDIAELEPVQLSALASNIRGWCDHHDVDAEALAKPVGKTARLRDVSAPTPVPPTGANALERLLAAQSREVAAQLTVPIDIALALSRMP